MGPSLKWWIVGTAVTLLILLLMGACAATRAGYWSPKYRVVERASGDVPYEIREYPALVLAATPSKSETEGRDGSFMRLFRFITGKNEEGRKIPMTTPVFFRGSGSSETMSFVMPEKDGAPAPAPKPSDEQVRIEQRPEGTYGVLRMSGRRIAERQSALQRLESGLSRSSWTAVGSPEFASYDPPWIPRFARRDEVLLPVKPRQEAQPKTPRTPPPAP
jgi:hypothetical protein